MDLTNPVVELSAHQSVDADNMTERKGVLSLNDVGIDEDIARARVVTFNVFCGDYFGSVPILRLATAYNRGRGVCLSQVVTRSQFPIMGETAILSPISQQLIENEKEIAWNAFLTAKAA